MTNNQAVWEPLILKDLPADLVNQANQARARCKSLILWGLRYTTYCGRLYSDIKL